jgi:hypothetical protein
MSLLSGCKGSKKSRNDQTFRRFFSQEEEKKARQRKNLHQHLAVSTLFNTFADHKDTHTQHETTTTPASISTSLAHYGVGARGDIAGKHLQAESLSAPRHIFD